MTTWLPDISEGSGPLYVRLAERIEADIASGLLVAGSKLPPQRNLAFDIKVTVGTVSRAYALARQRGLVSGEVGRGTYVVARDTPEPGHFPALPEALSGTRPAAPEPGKMRLDSTAAPDVGQVEIIERLTGEIAREHPHESLDYVRAPAPRWLEAGRRWLACAGWRPDEENIVPALGGHAAILAVIAAATTPGDRVVFEHLTFSSVARSASLIGRRPVAIHADRDGADPDDFERLCAQQHPKMAFLMPCLQNPTLTTLSEERRHAIVDIARRYNVWLIEDAIYSVLLDERPTPLAALAPERTFHVGGLSKAVAAGIRAGWVACPPHSAPRVQTAYKMLTGGKSFLLAELAARLVISGAADTILGRVKAEIAAREALAREHFAGFDFSSHPCAPFLWLKLPDPWLSGTFKNAAANEGVLIDDEDEFKCGRTDRIFHRARIAFSAPATREELVGGFARLRALLDSGVAGYDSFE